jgi:hypothetical protein
LCRDVLLLLIKKPHNHRSHNSFPVAASLAHSPNSANDP